MTENQVSASPLVGVVVGTRSDFNMMRRGLETLRIMGVPYAFEVISPHRNPERLAEFARAAGEHGIEVIITAEGGAAQIVGHIASHTTLPIIGVPIDASPLRGQDALFSMAMVPPGLPIATVGINNSENAAVLATQILALKHSRFREILAHRRMAAQQRAEGLQRDLLSEYPDLCRADRTAPFSYPHAEGESEAITPDVPDDSQRIRPGAIWTDRPPDVQSLVSTPLPHEPGLARPPTPAPPPRSLTSLVGDPLRATESGFSESETLGEEETPAPRSASILRRAETPVPVTERPTEVRPIPRETKIFRVDRTADMGDLMDHAMMVLLEGGILALPTDTVYGLSADATNEAAVDRLYSLGEGEQQKTLGVLIHHPDLLSSLVTDVPAELEKVIEECWPGAITIILPRREDTLTSVAKTDRIGVRIPSDPLCLGVLERLGRPLLVRNASLQSASPMTDASPVIERFSGEVDCILDGGPCLGSAGASTVLDAMNSRFEVLREGAIGHEKLKELLGQKLKDSSEDSE